MKIIWNSSTPQGTSGYGCITRHIVPRLVKAGHEVRIAVKHWFHGWSEWEGVEMCDGRHFDHISRMIEKEGFDYIISCWDLWIMHCKQHFPKDKWVAYVPLDTEWMAQRYEEVLLGTDIPGEQNRGAGHFIAMSKHCKRELETIGIKAPYIPVGVDAKLFKPDPDGGAEFRKCVHYTDEDFAIGAVGLNYGDDRKGFILLMLAFKEFLKTHPEARLYLHTHAEGRDNAINYVKVCNNLGLYDHVLFVDQGYYDLHRVSESQLAKVYNGFDVLCLPTKGEGFGMPMVEAAACGTPVITTATTTGPEFHDAGIAPWLIDVDKFDDQRWMPTGTFRLEPKPSEILRALECAYQAWKYGDWAKIKEGVRKAALKYDWDIVWEKNWVPILNVLESNLKEKGASNYV